VPAQHAIEPALGGRVDITHLLEPGGRLRDQRDFAWERMTAIPGVTCYQPAGALYLFPRLDPEVYPIRDDEQMMIDLLEQQHVLLSHGSGFNLPTTDHLRMVFLASIPVLDDAIGRLATFLAGYHQ
jgi:alanine-synthesizing transaminase